MGKNLSIVTISLLLLLASTSAGQVFNVKSYGGQPNADITQALTKAWKAACAVAGSKVVILAGTYKLGAVSLLGPCKGAIEFQLQGTLQAPSNVGTDFWVSFKRIDSLTVSGGGVFDGKGQTAWQKNSCAKNYNCKTLPINLQIQHVTITAPGDSPNTDGIHIGHSSKITINNAKIGTGDDCVSIGDGAQDVIVNQVICGPGHGISVGSLGRYQNEEPVSGIRVIGGTLSNTKNGVRIKTWPSSPPGTASDMHFENIIMNNVTNPILIDQGYCPNSQCSNKSPSKVKISNVSFKNIRGTSSTKEAMKLICSKSVPCQQVAVAGIDLVYKGEGGSATSTCVNVKPTVSGKQNPPACTSKQQ
uniref:Polygalacturonase n=1 Tax=Quercus lobata TaxID=97700 RepID=A0A7N2L8L5_QUELO